MLPITKKALASFESQTGIKPLSAKVGTGSMRGFFYIKVSRENPVIQKFIDNFYSNKPNSNLLNGLSVRFIGSRYTGSRPFILNIYKSELK